MIRSSVTEFPTKKVILDRWISEDTIVSPARGFTMDDSEVKNEVAALVNVTQQYGDPLEVGMIEDVDEGLATLRSKLKSAGIDKVVDTMQKQVNEYYKNLGR